MQGKVGHMFDREESRGDSLFSLIKTVLVSAFCLLVLSSCDRSDVSNEEKGLIRIPAAGSFGRALEKAYFEPFTEDTGIEVQIVAGGDDPIAAWEAQKTAGRIQFDLFPNDAIIVTSSPEEYVDHGLALPDDTLLHVSFPEKAVPLTPYVGWVIVCDRDAVDRCPRNYSEFFNDDDFPGDRAVPNVGAYDVLDTIEAALIADGYEREALYPLDLDKAFVRLEGVRDSIRVFWASFSGAQDVIRSGEAPIVLLNAARAHQLEAIEDMNLVISYQGASAMNIDWVIPRGAPNPDGARIFMQWAIDNPQAQGVMAKLAGYGPVTVAGAEAADKLGVGNHVGLHLEAVNIRTTEEIETVSRWVDENLDEMMNRWNEFVSR